MMNHYNAKQGLFNYALVLIFIFMFFSSIDIFAQQIESFERGIVRIKVSEELATQLERAQVTRNGSNVLLTGITSIDNVSQRYKISGIKRVFRPAGKFEAKHREYGLHRWYEVQMDKASPVLEILSAYKQIEQIQKVEPVYKKAIVGSSRKDFGAVIANSKNSFVTLPGASNDPMLPSQWHYNNTGQTGGTAGSDIKLFQAWGLETGKSQVIVAVTDGGIQVNHPDLAANIWVNTGEIPGNNIDDDNNGYVDDINGYGFGDNTGTIAPDQHGTHVGGTIAATTNNGIGVAGIAGGSGVGDGARLMSCAAFGATNSGGFAETYIYGADNGAVISQNSWGYTSPDVFEQAVLDGIDYFIAEAGKDEFGNQVGPMKGGIVIFAAGNDNDSTHHYPGFYAPTLSVSGTNHVDKKAWYSNFGDWVDIAAPGGETNTVTQQGVLSTLSNNQYGFFQGTSMATPHVSGVAALIVSKFGGSGLTPDMVRSRLIQTTDNIDGLNPTFAGLLGSGRMNAFAALQQNDDVPPNAITNLATTAASITTVTLSWTSPIDVGNGSASLYDIRYSTLPIDSSNFNSASVALNPPSPKAAGSQESFVINGLSPGTLYHFAIKSSDFFGNVSAISNVVQKATNFPPAISVSPSTISGNLQTAGTSSQTLSILNTGQGSLSFTFTNFEGSFVTPSSVGDTIAAGGQKDIVLTLDANNLLAGTYQQDLIILSNDPVNDSISVPITLNVINNGIPIAIITPDTLNFGGLFIGGSISKNLKIHNSGSDTLMVIQEAISNPDFITNLTNFNDTLKVAPFEDVYLAVKYSASTLGVSSGTLLLGTNDPISPAVTISLFGEGLEAPAIVVTPDSLVESLNTGNTSTRLLTVANTGASNLEFSIKVASATTGKVSVKQLDLPVQKIGTSSAGQKQKASAARRLPRQVQIKSVGQSAISTKVLIVTPDSDVSDLASILNSFDDVEAVAFPVASLPLISVTDLLNYDIVMTTNNGQWLATGGIDPVTIGNVLADYIDQGGKVIVNEFAYSYDAWKMEGRFIDEQYGPFIPSTTDENISTSLGTILAPGHPIMSGVSTLNYSGYVQNVGLASGSTALAEWANGELFLAANANVVALNLLPSLGDGGALQWDGDLPTIYQNAIHWLSGPSFVKVNPTTAIVAPGGQLDLQVTFDASGLAGGFYFASIDIASNVPGNELISVPARLNVLGPEFTVSPDSIYEVLEKGGKSSQTLLLSNNGTGDQSFEISILNKGVSSSKQPVVSIVKTEPASARIQAPVTKREKPYAGPLLDRSASQSIAKAATSSSKALVVAQDATGLYATDFENFSLGDIDGQQNWAGQFGNWTIELGNAASGQKHFRGLSDGLGQSLAFSPEVAVGSEAKSTATMKISIQGSGVTWQIIPQSTSAALVNTRVEFSPDGGAKALVSDGAGGGFYQAIPATVPTGYFDFTIELDRATAVFDIFFNDQKVFTGQGFAGDIEEVVVFSLMEVAGPIFDIDDFQILDGVRDNAPSYITVSPLSGNLAAGESIAITVNFDATELEFGTYKSDVVIDIANVDQLVVPTVLEVVGDAAIEVDPTVLQATVAYKEDTLKTFEIRNTGGALLNYSMQVIGASTNVSKLPPSPVSKFAVNDKRILEKRAKDEQQSKALSNKKQTSIELLAGSALLEENFEEASFPPSGWSIKDNEGTGVVWGFSSTAGEGNYSGTGEAATVSSDAFGAAEFDSELATPIINVSGYQNVTIQYMANYQNYANLDFLDLDIRVGGDSSWTTVLKWNEDHGGFRGAPGEFVSIALDQYLGTAVSFQLRWHYYDPNDGDYDWYAQIDNVVVLGDPRAWLTVSPASGSIPVRGTKSIEAHFDSKDIDPGFYVAGILVSSNAVKNPLVGIVASLDVMEPASIVIDIDELNQELFVGKTATQKFLVSNHGESPLKFSFEGVALQASTGIPLQRRQPIETRSTLSTTKINLNDATAITSGVSKYAGVEQYATGFEEFATGDIDAQNGWAGQYGNWTVEGDNPYTGGQHFSGLSDGLGQSLAFSPQVAIGTEAISSVSMKIDLSSMTGVTWQIIPQSNTAALVNTRFQISPDGSLQALVADSLGNASYESIVTPLPAGYFEFRIEVERATSIFRIFFNEEKVFVGQGFAGDIEQIAVLSLMEVAGPILDIDNFAILDGTPQAPWLLINPLSGIIPSGGSLPVTVTFDARELQRGVYVDTLHVVSNDPANSLIDIPAVLTVIDNHPPVLDTIAVATVVETGILKVTFTASDPDNDEVVVELENVPGFISLENSADGKASYVIKPLLGNAGVYDLLVTAQDARGLRDSSVFHLTVTPYGVKNFSLINTSTNEVVLDFDDSLTVDIAHPDFSKFTIRANTSPADVGSVIFRIDGRKRTTENFSPYDLNRSVFGSLSLKTHTIKAQAYTKMSGHGAQGKSKEAIINVVNLATITSFDVVTTSGQVLMELHDGDYINIKDPAFRNISIVARIGKSKVGSVYFKLNNHKHVENISPYSLNGDVNGYFNPWAFQVGNYSLKATTYSKSNKSGVAGGSLAISFKVIRAAVSNSPSARQEVVVDGDEIQSSDGVNNTALSIYPVPVRDKLYLKVKSRADADGNVEIAIINNQGQVLLREKISSDKIDELQISTNELGLTAGVYYVQVIHSDGKREMKKFVKE